MPTRVVDGMVQIETPRRRRAARRLVVAGNGMAGMRTVEELLKLGVADRFAITVFGAEPRGNYNRILLSPVLSGEQQADDIMLHRPSWYTRRGITLHSGDPIVEIDRKRRMVRSKQRRESRLRPAAARHGLRSDRAAAAGQGPARRRRRSAISTTSNRMLEARRTDRRAVVIGGGLLGLEAAHGLRAARHARDRRASARHAHGTPARRAGRRAAQGGAREARHRVPHEREDRRRSWASERVTRRALRRRRRRSPRTSS